MSEKKQDERPSKAMFEAVTSGMLKEAADAIGKGDWARAQALTGLVTAGQLVLIRRKLERLQAVEIEVAEQAPKVPMAKGSGSVH